MWTLNSVSSARRTTEPSLNQRSGCLVGPGIGRGGNINGGAWSMGESSRCTSIEGERGCVSAVSNVRTDNFARKFGRLNSLEFEGCIPQLVVSYLEGGSII